MRKDAMLHEFLTLHRDAIITRTREKMTNRPWPLVSTSELENGVPLFLTQLSETLRAEATVTAIPPSQIGEAGMRHGRELMALGFNVSQVVHDYGDICQAVTEIALEHNAPVTVDEFHTLNRCLDDATAQAVTEHARLTAIKSRADETVKAGQLGHELRNLINTALFAFQTLKQGTVAINGSTGMVLGRTLMSLRDTIDSGLSDVRLGAGIERHEPVHIRTFIDEIAVVANLHAEYRHLRFRVEPMRDDVTVAGDPQLLMSAVMNLLNNAFKFTRPQGRVVLSAYESNGHLIIEVEDECGGIPETTGDPFVSFADRRGPDRSGLGLGLSIARKAVWAHGGDISIRNMPGKGCVFVVDLPLTADQVPVAQMTT
jgi:signal transduction histidine kinase